MDVEVEKTEEELRQEQELKRAAHLARRREAGARYRERHPDRVAATQKKYKEACRDIIQKRERDRWSATRAGIEHKKRFKGKRCSLCDIPLDGEFGAKHGTRKHCYDCFKRSRNYIIREKSREARHRERANNPRKCLACNTNLEVTSRAHYCIPCGKSRKKELRTIRMRRYREKLKNKENLCTK